MVSKGKRVLTGCVSHLYFLCLAKKVRYSYASSKYYILLLFFILLLFLVNKKKLCFKKKQRQLEYKEKQGDQDGVISPFLYLFYIFFRFI